MDPIRILVAVLVAAICAVIVGYLVPGPAAFITFLVVLLVLLFSGKARV